MMPGGREGGGKEEGEDTSVEISGCRESGGLMMERIRLL